MFCTIISDAYKNDEREKMYEWIDDLCSPRDNWGWASNGVYCYWNYKTKEILYIGLASDLGNRFRQHNGLVNCDENGCKIKEINNYFEANEKLGFSIIVQPSRQQISNFRNSNTPLHHLNSDENDTLKENLGSIEGNLIKAHELCYGKIPCWNKINGAISRSDFNDFSILDFLVLKRISFLNAKSSLRELSKNNEFAFHEYAVLHAVRHMNVYHPNRCSFLEMIQEFEKIDIFANVHNYKGIYEYINNHNLSI